MNLETRCTGLEEGARAGGSEIIGLPLPANIDGNAATAEALKAELLKDPAIDSVVTLATALTGSAAPPAGPTWCRPSCFPYRRRRGGCRAGNRPACGRWVRWVAIGMQADDFQPASVKGRAKRLTGRGARRHGGKVEMRRGGPAAGVDLHPRDADPCGMVHAWP
ncbi:type 1 periplasmic-binding domain-containing protein [Tabrizicola oligotrophica]|uniref:Uncharacterized protein n=1 Tax=Tabrizicola oligotrophica TaxID=2710650 RepID=A0A6M0QUG9_9RHOB|nr:hypothetical protein [Tabrizicola oligotrophica]NEY90474.1 hypothetical protein [Tabrizicola oligotrophica]